MGESDCRKGEKEVGRVRGITQPRGEGGGIGIVRAYYDSPTVIRTVFV